MAMLPSNPLTLGPPVRFPFSPSRLDALQKRIGSRASQPSGRRHCSGVKTDQHRRTALAVPPCLCNTGHLVWLLGDGASRATVGRRFRGACWSSSKDLIEIFPGEL
nr:unnamed protein product [Digitaria exilis]